MSVLKIVILFPKTHIPFLNIIIQFTALFLIFWWTYQFWKMPGNRDIDLIILSIGILCNIGPFLSVTKFGKKFKWLLLIFFIPSFLMSLLLFFRYSWILTAVYSIFVIAIMQMFKKTTLAIALSIFIGITLIIQTYIFFSMTPQERYFYHELKHELKQGHKIIPLKKLTNFKWEKVIFCWPYGLRTDIKSITFEQKNYQLDKKVDLESDGAWALIFINQNQNKAILILGNDNYIYDRNLKKGIFTNNVKFKIIPNTGINYTEHEFKLFSFKLINKNFTLSE